jgi:TetR/AcrR family transcriptional regulator, repressor for uid operon
MMVQGPNPATGLAPEGTSSRDRILFAGKHLFAKEGYENTSTAAIARLAGTSESQLVKHFGSKEGLLEAIFDAGWAEMAYSFRAIHDLPSPAEKLEVLLELLVTALDRDPELKELMLLEGRRIRKEGRIVLLTRGYQQFVRVVDGILSEMRASGELRDDIHVDAIRSGLASMFEGMLRDQVIAVRMGFPATYDSTEVKKVFKVVLAGFVKGSR